MSDSKGNRPRREANTILDVVGGFPETTPLDVEALRGAAGIPLGPARTARWLRALGASVTSEALARRPHSIGEPFSLDTSRR